jgi:hypothetical protein
MEDLKNWNKTPQVRSLFLVDAFVDAIKSAQNSIQMFFCAPARRTAAWKGLQLQVEDETYTPTVMVCKHKPSTKEACGIVQCCCISNKSKTAVQITAW